MTGEEETSDEEVEGTSDGKLVAGEMETGQVRLFAMRKCQGVSVRLLLKKEGASEVRETWNWVVRLGEIYQWQLNMYKVRVISDIECILVRLQDSDRDTTLEMQTGFGEESEM